MSLMDKNLYWMRVVEEIEHNARQDSKQDMIKWYDYSVTLPEKLRKKVEKIIPYEYDDDDDNNDSEVEAPPSFSDNENREENVKEPEKADDFNESTCSQIEHLEYQHPQFVLNIDKPLEHKAKTKTKHNWYSSYICKARKERIKWDSKLYDLERSIWEKTLDEQAEQLMDASAEHFTNWLNSLGSNRDSDISKEKLKALFSIEGDRKLLSSIHTEPKEVKAIAKTVADRWNLPEMAIELKYEDYIKTLLAKAPHKFDTVAFGYTIPMKDRPWLPNEYFKPIQTVFPEELLSFEKLFKGIRHLRSTKELAEFYEKRPNMSKPHYLVSKGLFKRKTEAHTLTEVPLYERLKLKY